MWNKTCVLKFNFMGKTKILKRGVGLIKVKSNLGLDNSTPLLLSFCFLGCNMYVSEADPICALQVISFLKKCILKLATAFKHSKEFMTNVHPPFLLLRCVFFLFLKSNPFEFLAANDRENFQILTMSPLIVV